MDKVVDLTTMVSEVVKSYVVKSFDARLYYAENPAIPLYTVLVVPNDEHWAARAMVLARIEDGMAIIEVDNTDRYLYRLLVRAGVPRDKIIRAYLGETVPLSQIPVD
jgi:hypothetical protein